MPGVSDEISIREEALFVRDLHIVLRDRKKTRKEGQMGDSETIQKEISSRVDTLGDIFEEEAYLSEVKGMQHYTVGLLCAEMSFDFGQHNKEEDDGWEDIAKYFKIGESVGSEAGKHELLAGLSGNDGRVDVLACGWCLDERIGG